MFKAGERVIHHRYGEGVLVSNTSLRFPLEFIADEHDNNCTVTTDGREHERDHYPSIFYKEQTFDMGKPEPEIGTWGYFWDVESHSAVLFSVLKRVYKDCDLKYYSEYGHCYRYFSPEIPPHIKALMDGTNNPNP